MSEQNTGSDAASIEAAHKSILGLLKELEAITEAESAAEHARLLGEQLLVHFKDEERVGGIFDEMSAVRPSLSRKIAELQREHRDVRERVEALLSCACCAGDWQCLRDELVSCLRAHEAAETEMMQDCFYEDIGGSG